MARLFDPPPELVEDVYLLMHERRSRAVRAVADALGQVFREGADVLRGNHSVSAATDGDEELSSSSPLQPVAASFEREPW